MKNNTIFLLFLFLTTFLACKTDPVPASTESDNSISGLEKSVEATNDKAKTQELLTAYQQYIDGNSSDTETNASYLYRMAALYFRQNQYPNAADALMKVLRSYKGSSVEGASFHLLGDLFSDNLNYPALGQDIFMHLKKSFPDYKEMATINKKINVSATPLADRINKIASEIYDESTGLPNARMARKYIAACEVNGLVHPGDTTAAELLFKAATTARTTGRNPKKALEIYDWVYKQFPDYKKSYQALFLKAFTLDDNMQKYDEARTHYEAFLKEYPDDEFAVSTKFLLENLGKSDDEIIKQFEKKRQ